MTAETRASLEQLEATGLDPGASELQVMLCWLVSEDVEIPTAELNAARRRAMLVLAAGGDPHRDLAVDSIAVQRLADELDTPERRASLADALGGLPTAGLPTAAAAVDALHAEPDAAWRSFALALLADEIGDE